MIAIDKYVICRATVTTVLIGAVIGAVYYIGVNIASILAIIGLVGNLPWFFVIAVVSWGVAFLPIILTNLIWYGITTKNDDLVVIPACLDVVLIACELVYVPCAAIGGNSPGSIAYDWHQTYLIWNWLPLIILSLNVIFILVYYTVGKRTCKLIYGTKKESEDAK